MGYLLELFYRRFTKQKWIKPGVFKGIYLPLYGMGLCICYFAYTLNINFVFKIALTIFLLTFIEFLCGIIFIKYFKLPLWDYSNNFLNYKGLICFKFSIYWGILSFIFIKFVFPFINFSLFINKFIFVIYILCFVVIVDVLVTMYKYIKNKL